MDVKIRKNETPLDHHKRLIYGKLVDKTLADVDYSELAEELYGKAYASDVARRMIYGSRKTLELMDSELIKNAKDEDAVKSIDNKIQELEKERQKFYDQRREYKKILSSEGRFDRLFEQLVEAANSLNESVPADMFDFEESDSKSTNRKDDAVLVFSDWHYGMVSDNIYNKYNTEICKERLEKVVRSVTDKLELHNINTLHIVILGDMFNGAIHVTSRVESEELACDQLMQVSEILAKTILKLKSFVSKIVVHMTYGNHGRAVQRKKESVHADNFEKIIPWWLNQRLQNYTNISITSHDESGEFMLIPVKGYNFLAAHGDLDNVRQSPRLLSTLFQKVYGVNIDYILLGDKHHYECFDELGVSSYICGSLCGTDSYANTHRLYSEPEQTLFTVNSNGVDAEYRIKAR